MAFLRKRGKVWYVYWYEDNKLHGKRISTFKEIAPKKLRQLEYEIDAKKHLPSPPQKHIRFHEFAEKYLVHSKATKAPSSHRRDRLSLMRLKDYFAGKELKDIRSEDIEEYRQERLQKVSISTLNREVACLRHLCNLAVEWGYLERNPVKKVKFFKEPPGGLRYLSQDEAKRLLSVCTPHLKPIVSVALNTGMRKGEILNLKWTDINLKNQTITIRHSKSNEIRIIPRNHTIRELFETLPETNEFVFSYKDIKTGFDAAVKRAGIKDFRFHDLRHTFASHLAMNGWSIQTIQQLLGHKTLRMALRYSHLSKTHLQDAVNSLNLTDNNNIITFKKLKSSKAMMRG